LKRMEYKKSQRTGMEESAPSTTDQKHRVVDRLMDKVGEHQLCLKQQVCVNT